MKKYIAIVEETNGNTREQWAWGRDGRSLTSSGRWTDAYLFDTKKAAQAQADEMAEHFTGDKVKAFTRTVEI